MATREFNEVERELYSQGYKYLGSGCFSKVYGRDGDNVVVKVCYRGFADSWLKYARWVMETKPTNPHFPKIYSLEIYNETNDSYIARMERLEPAQHHFCQGEEPFVRGQYLVGYYEFTGLQYEKEKVKDISAALMIEAAKMLRDWQITIGANRDWHGGNVMIRHGELPVAVITDPVS